MTIHIGAEPGDIAKTILLPGEPLRAKYIAETYLEDLVCYNNVRGMLGYTGTYNGKTVSVQGTGMGVPSISIYVHELINEFGVQNLIRVGTCGALQPELLDLSDDELIQSTRKQLKELLGVRGEPIFTEVARWTNTMPQYHVGHVELVDSIETQLEDIAGLELAGNAYRGVGIPLCVRSGKLAAERIIGTEG